MVKILILGIGFIIGIIAVSIVTFNNSVQLINVVSGNQALLAGFLLILAAFLSYYLINQDAIKKEIKF